MNLNEVGGAHRVADVPHHNQPGARDDRPQQLCHALFAGGQIRGQLAAFQMDADFRRDAPELPVKRPAAEPVFFHARPQHEDVVCDGQVVHQAAALLDHRGFVVRHGAVPVVVDEGLVKINAPIMDGRVPANQANQGFLADFVEADEPHDFPLKNVQVEMVQQGCAVLEGGDLLQAQNLIFHTCFSRLSESGEG